MLFGRTEFLFGLGEFQRMEQEGAGFLRFDDGIDEAACGCDIRVGELLGIFFHFLLAHSPAISALGQAKTKSAPKWREFMAI